MMYPPRTHSLTAILVTSISRHGAWLRWLPFTFAAATSVAVSGLAPDGRKPFQIDWTMSLEALSLALGKGPHVGASALLALFAVIATGRLRLAMAFGLTVLVGAAWELAQTTVLGHRARMSDLAPDAFGALLGCGWGACLVWLTEPQHRLHRSRRAEVGRWRRQQDQTFMGTRQQPSPW